MPTSTRVPPAVQFVPAGSGVFFTSCLKGSKNVMLKVVNVEGLTEAAVSPEKAASVSDSVTFDTESLAAVVGRRQGRPPAGRISWTRERRYGCTETAP